MMLFWTLFNSFVIISTILHTVLFFVHFDHHHCDYKLNNNNNKTKNKTFDQFRDVYRATENKKKTFEFERNQIDFERLWFVLLLLFCFDGNGYCVHKVVGYITTNHHWCSIWLIWLSSSMMMMMSFDFFLFKILIKIIIIVFL